MKHTKNYISILIVIYYSFKDMYCIVCNIKTLLWYCYYISDLFQTFNIGVIQNKHF